nr:immunoglobulin heavy chain junction region [Mus musculus]
CARELLKGYYAMDYW